MIGLIVLKEDDDQSIGSVKSLLKLSRAVDKTPAIPLDGSHGFRGPRCYWGLC